MHPGAFFDVEINEIIKIINKRNLYVKKTNKHRSHVRSLNHHKSNYRLTDFISTFKATNLKQAVWISTLRGYKMRAQTDFLVKMFRCC